jgi:alpha-L-arabinofuranosidase
MTLRGARTLFLVAAAVLIHGVGHSQEPGQITIRADLPGATINPNFYGLMTEEINHAYDGGLYAELIQNRLFKDNASAPDHWSVVATGGGAGTISLDTANPINAALTTCLRLSITAPGTRVGVANDGFWGIPILPNTTYRASFYAKATSGLTGPLTLSLEDADFTTGYAQATSPAPDGYWRKYYVTLKTGAVTPDRNGRFVISASSAGTLRLNQVSLFPPVYGNRPPGFRADLMEKMAAMKPRFLRFPGGNHLDPGHFEWKKTIGPVDDRPGHDGAWGYRSSDGIGLLEFLLWCEELGIEPVLGVTDGRGWLANDADVGFLVQDALDEIEYITGDASTYWGAKRVADGHPEPFNLRYVEIGNEDFFDPQSVYNTRFAKFYDGIRARYPNLKIIATRRDVTSRRPDLVDDHLYSSVSGMQAAAHNYDNYDRNAPPVFVGEFATTVGSPTPPLRSALSDAAYLTGLERNADIVVMACYAPLMVNVNPGASQWSTNLIGYDNTVSFGSPSYWMQTMFASNKGDVVLPVTVIPQAAPAFVPRGKIGVGTWATVAEYRNVKVTSGGVTLYQKDFTTGADGWTPDGGTWQVVNDALRQTSTNVDCRNTAGDTSWTDYTLTLQARKISGAEGFLIMFHVENHDDFIWWNIGGWNNTRTAIERAWGGSKSQLGAASNVTVQTNRWYDIRIEVQRTSIKCYLDGTLIHDTVDASTVVEPVFASASRELATGDVILKVVNVTSAPQQLRLNVSGLTGVSATGQVLTGPPDAVNTVSQPENIVSQPLAVTGSGQGFVQEFPAYSVSVMRLKQTGSPVYTRDDAITALQLASGVRTATPGIVQRLNAVAQGPSASVVDMADVTAVLRIAVGLG